MSTATQRARSSGFSHKGRTAHQVIDDPARDEACNGYADGLPWREHQHVLGDQIGAGIEIILHDEQQEARDPGEIGLPFEPDEIARAAWRARSDISAHCRSRRHELPRLRPKRPRAGLRASAGKNRAPQNRKIVPIQAMPAIMWPQRSSRFHQSLIERTGPRQPEGKAKRHKDDRQGPGDLVQRIAHFMAHQEMPQRHAAHNDEPRQESTPADDR